MLKLAEIGLLFTGLRYMQRVSHESLFLLYYQGFFSIITIIIINKVKCELWETFDIREAFNC